MSDVIILRVGYRSKNVHQQRISIIEENTYVKHGSAPDSVKAVSLAQVLTYDRHGRLSTFSNTIPSQAQTSS